MNVQVALGLRPSELLGLEKGDVDLPLAHELGVSSIAALRLGAFVGTKAKHEQVAILRRQEHPEVFVLRWGLGGDRGRREIIPLLAGRLSKIAQSCSAVSGVGHSNLPTRPARRIRHRLPR